MLKPPTIPNTFGFNFDNSYLRLPEMCYSKQLPTPVIKPEMLLFNEELAAQLGIKGENNLLAQVLTGNVIVEGSEPIAQAYAGHQFGYFTMLGDGRAHLLGEHITPLKSRFDLQLKGSGPTAYSRRGDGRATVSAMLREYVMSESMHALGIPTSRSLAVVNTGEIVIREQYHRGAVLTRVAGSHLRVGHFEFMNKAGNAEAYKIFLAYTIQRHYPHLTTTKNPALSLLEEVMHNQIRLVIDWMRVGFIHGVMNTDNMSISGETIDYGPCAFMNTYNPETVFSSIDKDGRYAFINQPGIAQWNLAVLAGALLPLISTNKEEALAAAQEIINTFPSLFENGHQQMMLNKLGLKGNLGDDKLIENLLELMTHLKLDYTNTFYALTVGNREYFTQHDALETWYDEYQLAVKNDNAEVRLKLMQQTNPAFIPRNHIVEEALELAALNNETTQVQSIIQTMKKTYDYNYNNETYRRVPQNDNTYKTFCGT